MSAIAAASHFSFIFSLRHCRCYSSFRTTISAISVASLSDKGFIFVNVDLRFCLRHIQANFNKTFKNIELKSLMWQAGMESKQWKFDRVMHEIQDRNVDAYIYLVKIDLDKWTLLHDGGHRHGIMITNISEALNIVLKKARVLPLKAPVEFIFNKLVRYFNQHSEEVQNCVHPFPTRVFDKFLQIELKSRDHKVTTYNPREAVYMFRSPIRVDGTDITCIHYE
ncbi:hypothetical protein M9H77_27441 [Catharanthus roseus]|uniref:Uncharacterized protein n=1 Tax=Catharanthus roseus TaxID=4058 RepID=A0ACC0ACH8_CATRO|nr:hypothetical protein M9H77_27441 [Catharanthus roseus]